MNGKVESNIQGGLESATVSNVSPTDSRLSDLSHQPVLGSQVHQEGADQAVGRR